MARRALLCAITTAAVAASLVVATAPGSSAAAGDLPLAIAETELDITRALADGAFLNAENPEATCANPVAFGSVVVPPVHLPNTVSVYGQDQAEAAGQCASLQLSAYSVSLRTVVEWRSSGGAWAEITACEAASSAPASFGAATVVTPPFVCSYGPTAPPAGKPHRVHAYLTNSVTGATYEGYSQVYLGPTPKELVEASQS